MFVLTEIDLYMTYKGVKETSSMKTFQIPKWLQFELLTKFHVNHSVSRKEIILQKNNQLFIDSILTEYQKSCWN